jgi:hypothetical protein
MPDMPGQRDRPASRVQEHAPADIDPALHALVAPRLTTRQRAVRAAFAIGMMLLALFVLLGSSPSLRSGAALLLFGPTPTPTVSVLRGDGIYYLDTDLPNMAVTLDGQPLPPSSLGARRPILLARGHHYLSWRAEPFMPQSCMLSVPARAEDTCPRMASPGDPDLPVQRFLLLHETLPTLPLDRQQALIAELQRAVANLGATVQPGEAFLADAPAATGTSRPLRATLRVRLELVTDQTDTGRSLPLCSFTRDGNAERPCTAAFSLEDCAALCILPFSAAADDFLALAPAMLSWDYRTMSGRPIAQDQPVGYGGIADDLPALFRITWDGTDMRWHASLLSGPALGAPILVSSRPNAYYDDVSTRQLADNLACIPAMDFFFANLPLQGWTGEVQGNFRSDPNPAEGCLITARGHDLRGNEATAQFIMRFGMYFAVDEASAATRAAAHKLEQYPGQIVNTLPLGVYG